MQYIVFVLKYGDLFQIINKILFRIRFMLINRIRLSAFMKNSCIEYNPENTIKLLELFKEKEVMPSFVTEISRDMKLVKRPIIKNNIDNILLIIGS